MMENGNVTIYMNGGQLNNAKDNAIINATQNNGVTTNDLDKIFNGILENLSGLKEEDADSVKSVVEMAKGELSKPEPKVGILKNCLTLIAPMVTIANGIPVLASNLQKLADYIMLYFK